MRKLRMYLRELEYTLQDGFDWLFSDELITAGKFVIDLFVLSASAYYAITNTLPIIPRWAWVGIFAFMVIAGTFSLIDLVYIGYDEDGNKLPDEEDEYEDDDDEYEDVEDEEIVEG